MHNAWSMDLEPASAPGMEPQPPRPPAPPSTPTPRAAIALFVVVLAANIGMSLTFELFSLESDWLLLSTPVLLLALTLGAARLSRVDLRETLMLRLPSAGELFMAFPLAVSFVVLSDQLSSLTQQLVPIPEELTEGMVEILRVEGPLDWAIKLATIGLLAAVSEELLFRGFIQNGLLRGTSRSAAVLWTALMFMVMHVLPLPSFAAAGAVLGIVALSTRSIVVPIIVHFLNNVAALALLNLAGLETLAEPVWIPPTILLPAIAIFVITMGYYSKRLLEEVVAARDTARPPAPPPREEPSFRPRRWPSLGEELASVPPHRRRLGWIVVVFAVAIGASVLGGGFAWSIYLVFPKDVHASFLEALEQESERHIAPDAQGRVQELEAAFDTLEAVNAAGSLTGGDVWEVTLAYARATTDGVIDAAELDALVAEIQRIVRDRTRPRRL